MSTPNQPSRDRNFHLAATDRAMLRSGVDADALEEFLQLHRPDQRAGLLQSFQAPLAIVANEKGEIPDMHVLERVSDPVLQEVLERVWAPTRAAMSLQRKESTDARTTAIRAAMERRRAAKERPE